MAESRRREVEESSRNDGESETLPTSDLRPPASDSSFTHHPSPSSGGLDVYAGISALVDKSLLRQEEGDDGEPRFRMLETIREFGLERLDASDEAEATRRRLAAWCLRLAEGAEPPSTAGSMAPGWITRLEAERPNLRTAITWLLERGEAAVVLRLLAATADYWVHRYNYAEISSWANAALGGAPEASAIDRSAVHGLMVFVDSMLGDHDAAVAHAKRGLQAARAAGDAAAMGAAQYNVGLAWEHGDDGQRAAEAYAQAVTLLEAAGETGCAAWAQADWAD
jgi:hypothetical protein